MNKSPESIIIEIRAGAGGEEAALFAKDLFEMYQKHGGSQGWRLKVLDSRPSDLGGLKEIVFEVSGPDVFSQMQYEGGVHRVQRIPRTEKKGRLHTSTASVAVLAKPKEAEIKIKPQDLKIETFRASGPGGQHLQKTESAVRLTHLPSGLTARSQASRLQGENKKQALAILQAKLLGRKEKGADLKLQQKRQAQIGWAKRAEKIRTYNFPQNRVTDHRLQKSWYNLERILGGGLDVIIKAFQKNEATERSEAQHKTKKEVKKKPLSRGL